MSGVRRQLREAEAVLIVYCVPHAMRAFAGVAGKRLRIIGQVNVFALCDRCDQLVRS
jgi:hypothetical protein